MRLRVDRLTRLAVWLSALPVTIDISRARKELDYHPIRSRQEGLDELTAATTTNGG